MEQQLVGLVVGGLAVVARHHDSDVVGHQGALELGQTLGDALGHSDGVGAGPLGERDRDGGRPVQRPVRQLGVVPGLALERLGADDDVGDVAHVDGAAVARGEQQEADVGNSLQCLSGGNT